ncbi:hypothetical protein SAMN04489740_0204 [Arthrobacter alpinus]|uniref:Lipoprotein n=1 Tax=Arthrobacter alpinus TaxID=656366 RepID=A0A1H5EBW2_9MICC|nr:hypothetical protein [Arthrobacter alpinus]SED88585.1 hypothetical protein SAMN04489740_0204 [Arthrobacter alpinus]
MGAHGKKSDKLPTTQTWVVVGITVALLGGCALTGIGKSDKGPTPPLSRIATSEEAKKVAKACGDHMQIYARNSFKTSNWAMSFVGDVKVAPPSKNGEHRGYIVAVDVDLGGGSVAKMLCGVDADYNGQRFSYR